MIKIGSFNYQLDFYSSTPAASEDGGVTYSKALVESIKGTKEEKDSSTFLAYGSKEVKEVFKSIIRFVSWLDESYKVVHAGKEYEIFAVKLYEGRFLEITYGELK